MKTSALLATDTASTCPLLTPGSPVAHGIVSQALLTAPGLRVTRLHFAAGQELSEHTSSARALVQVLAGSGTFTFDGQPHRLTSGDLLHLPPKLPHAVHATEAMAILLIQTNAPESEK